VIRAYDAAGNVIETHEPVGKFKESCAGNRYSQKNLPFNVSSACGPEKNYLTLAVGPDTSKRVAAPTAQTLVRPALPSRSRLEPENNRH